MPCGTANLAGVEAPAGATAYAIVSSIEPLEPTARMAPATRRLDLRAGFKIQFPPCSHCHGRPGSDQPTMSPRKASTI